MALIHAQVGKNFIDYVLINGGFRINIIIEKLKDRQLRLAKSKPTPYNLHMGDETIVKPLGLIKDLNLFFPWNPLYNHIYYYI